jgi:plasmid segregation protein ParM
MNRIPFIIGARSVDVGYFNTKHTGGKEGASTLAPVYSFPSIAPVLRSGLARSMESQPQPDGCVVRINDVSHFVGPGALHRGSGAEARLVKDDYAGSDRYLALLRGALWRIAKEATDNPDVIIRRLGLGLPLNTYFDAVDQLTKRATGLHLVGASSDERRITVEKVRVLVQPQGTIINFGHSNGGKPLDGVTMVVDPGGGTLDWYLTEGKTPYWERSGAYPKAMLACANAVADRIEPKWRNQAAIIDRIDRAIREKQASFTVQGQDFPMALHRPAVAQVLDESLDHMLAAVGSVDDVDHLLFTGGGASVFCEHMQKRYPHLKKISRIDSDPIFSNVRGFQVVANADLGSGRAR